MLVLLLAPLAHALEPPEVTADFGVQVQGFAAPEVGRQAGRALAVPTLELEGELRWDALALRGHVGVWPAPLAADAGVMLLHMRGPITGRAWGYGGELGIAHVYNHNRVYAGPTVTTRSPWRVGALTGVVGARLTAGLAVDIGQRNDWTFLSPGTAVGGHLGLALTFAADDGLE